MNLKEAFRYQNFLTTMMANAVNSITSREHSLTTVRIHNRNKVNPDAENLEEIVKVDEFTPNDTVIRFMIALVDEREKLSSAINEAKAKAPIDIDMSIEGNKFRKLFIDGVKRMNTFTASKRAEQGRDYKFNAEGNQVSYLYDIDVTTTESYNREYSKNIVREMVSKSDEISTMIDSVMINQEVDYDPPFNVNDDFEDVMKLFCSADNNNN